MGIFSFTFTGGGCFLHTKTILYNLTNLKIQHLWPHVWMTFLVIKFSPNLISWPHVLHTMDSINLTKTILYNLTNLKIQHLWPHVWMTFLVIKFSANLISWPHVMHTIDSINLMKKALILLF
jgi:hypothetical protein